MKIRDKLLIGFSVLIGITSVLGVVSIVQLNTMNTYYNELAEVDSKAMEIMQQMKLEVDYIIRDMYMYLDVSLHQCNCVYAGADADNSISYHKLPVKCS